MNKVKTATALIKLAKGIVSVGNVSFDNYSEESVRTLNFVKDKLKTLSPKVKFKGRLSRDSKKDERIEIEWTGGPSLDEVRELFKQEQEIGRGTIALHLVMTAVKNPIITTFVRTGKPN